MRRFDVILAAAGRGTRFGGDKLAELIDGRSVLARSVAAFADRPDVGRVIVATADGHRPPHLPPHDKLHTVPGGRERADTVAAALAVSDSEWVAVHDAARPLVSQPLIDRCFAAGTCVPCTPITGTVKRGRGTVEATLPRDDLWQAQTPQCFRRSDWLAADRAGATDDAVVLERAGVPVQIVPGEARNLKITTADDLTLARALADVT